MTTTNPSTTIPEMTDDDWRAFAAACSPKPAPAVHAGESSAAKPTRSCDVMPTHDPRVPDELLVQVLVGQGTKETNMNTLLIYVREGLVLSPEELPEHADDPDVAAILSRDWPQLFDREVEGQAAAPNCPPLNPPRGEP